MKCDSFLGQIQKKKNLLSENILGTGRSLGITFTHLIGMTNNALEGRMNGVKEFSISRQNKKKKILLSENILWRDNR